MAVTAADVAVWLDVQLDASETTLMDRIVAAVSAKVGQTHNVPPGPIFDQAVVMQSGRLWRRRDTPEGIAQFGGDFAIRVNRFDPDIDALLAPYTNWSLA